MGRYEDIPIGKENAITRRELALKWGVSDRLARHIIAKMRAEDNGDNFVIVAFSSRKGYYRTNDPKEIRRFEREMSKRARNTFARLKKARRVLKVVEGQKVEVDNPHDRKDFRYGNHTG